MKTRKLGSIIFFAVTLIVFGAGTVFTLLHRYDPDMSFFSKVNVLAAAAGCFLTVGELALIYLHKLIDDRQLWRRAAAYVMSLGLIGTITYAAGTEAKSYMEEGNLKNKAGAVAEVSKEQTANAKTGRERRLVITESQATLKLALADVKAPDFAPFAINFAFGLFCILTGALIQPREPWRRRGGNVMNDQIRGRAQEKIGFVPAGATAYEDGKGSSIIIKNGRDYLTTISKRDVQ